MIESNNDTQQIWDIVYHEVMALYAVLQGMPQTIRVRRAELRGGEVQAEAIDFIMDVQLKSERAIDSAEDCLYWLHVLHDPEDYSDIPPSLKSTLGKTFLENRLGACGDYRSLFYRVKNQLERGGNSDRGDVPSTTDGETGGEPGAA